MSCIALLCDPQLFKTGLPTCLSRRDGSSSAFLYTREAVREQGQHILCLSIAPAQSYVARIKCVQVCQVSPKPVLILTTETILDITLLR